VNQAVGERLRPRQDGEGGINGTPAGNFHFATIHVEANGKDPSRKLLRAFPSDRENDLLCSPRRLRRRPLLKTQSRSFATTATTQNIRYRVGILRNGIQGKTGRKEGRHTEGCETRALSSSGFRKESFKGGKAGKTFLEGSASQNIPP